MPNKFNNKDPYSSKVFENIKYSLIIGALLIAISAIYKVCLWLLN